MTALLKLRDASFGYQKRVVVENVTLEVNPGQFLGIMGPNGAGKTTLFRGMLGLLRPLAGSVERSNGAIGYVPQREALDAIYPLTSLEVVHMGAYGRLRGWRGLPAEDRQLARECLERVGLSGCSSAQFAALSGGQRQRVLMARALMVRPKLLLLDEPTSGVDAQAAQEVIELLKCLVAEEGLSVLLVSHQFELVRRAVDNILWVAEGTVVHQDADSLDQTKFFQRLFLSTEV